SCLATSVNTLTTGSHATVRVTGCLVSTGVLRASCRATGTRTRIEVSDSPSTDTEIVRVFNALAGCPARSALVSRLMVAACGATAVDCRAKPTRSLPEAYCAAPRLSVTARVPRIPEKSFDMACPPLILCRCKREQVHNAGCYVGFGTSG